MNVNRLMHKYSYLSICIYRSFCLAVVVSGICRASAFAYQADTIDAKAESLRVLATAADRNRSKIQTWSGEYAYEMSFYIPADKFKEFTADIPQESQEALENLSQHDEFIIHNRSGVIKFHRDLKSDSLLLDIKEDSEPTYSGNETGHVYLRGNVVRNEAVIIKSDQVLSYKRNLQYGLPTQPIDQIGDGRLSSTVVVTTPRNRKNGPVWPLDTDPWHGEYADPICFFGIDRPTATYLESYFGTLEGKFGKKKADLINSWVVIAKGGSPDNSVIVVGITRPEGARELTFADDLTGDLISYREFDGDSKQSSADRVVTAEMNWTYSKIDEIRIPSRVDRADYNPGTRNITSKISYSLANARINHNIDPAIFTEESLQAPANVWKLVKDGQGATFISPTQSKPRPINRLIWLIAVNVGLFGVILTIMIIRGRKLKSRVDENMSSTVLPHNPS